MYKQNTDHNNSSYFCLIGGMIWVEWDSGNKNCYTYDDRRHLYDIKPVNEPRRLIDEIIAVGCKVKRGNS